MGIKIDPYGLLAIIILSFSATLAIGLIWGIKLLITG
jgi:hypothetical protein